MHQVQLLDFAQHSQKIPSFSLEKNDQRPKVSSWRILFAHFVDFGFTFFAATLMATLFNEYFKTVLVTAGLKAAFSSQHALSLTVTILPIFVFTNFFFSYFLNHGQTYGMHLMKLRVQMKPMSYQDSFKWALQSLSLCFTCGLTGVLFQDSWGAFRNHDYLYEELMAFKTNNEIDLISRIDEIDEKWNVIIEKEAA